VEQSKAAIGGASETRPGWAGRAMLLVRCRGVAIWQSCIVIGGEQQRGSERCGAKLREMRGCPVVRKRSRPCRCQGRRRVEEDVLEQYPAGKLGEDADLECCSWSYCCW
jgi:hypothetical protein